MNNNTEGDFEVSQDTEANYVETVNVSLVEQQLNNSRSSAVEAAVQLRSYNGSFKVSLERWRERRGKWLFLLVSSRVADPDSHGTALI